MRRHLPRPRLFSGTDIPDTLDALVLHIRDSGSSKNNTPICAVIVLVRPTYVGNKTEYIPANWQVGVLGSPGISGARQK